MAKAKRYNGEDGSVTEGQNANIDDDTRARAMKFVQSQSDSTGVEETTPAAKTTTKATKTAKTESKAETKKPTADDEAGKSRGRPAEGAPKATQGANYRRQSTSEAMAEMDRRQGVKPMDPNSDRGPNAADSTELSRNLSAAANTFGPAASKAVRGATATAKGVNELVASRRAAAAVQAAREAREAKTLNPNAWMAGPKGMKENFKSGGGVKGWGIARGSRKAKTY